VRISRLHSCLLPDHFVGLRRFIDQLNGYDLVMANGFGFSPPLLKADC
jgi:hypothetical protein